MFSYYFVLIKFSIKFLPLIIIFIKQKIKKTLIFVIYDSRFLLQIIDAYLYGFLLSFTLSLFREYS